MVEPGQCGADNDSDAEIATLATVPLLVLFGDHLATPTYLPGPGCESRLHECVRLVKRRRGAQGCADLIHLPERGIDGNSHVVVQDRNNQQIADIVIDWFSDIRQYNASFSQFPLLLATKPATNAYRRSSLCAQQSHLGERAF
jgi:hypothetical protein